MKVKKMLFVLVLLQPVLKAIGHVWISWFCYGFASASSKFLCWLWPCGQGEIFLRLADLHLSKACCVFDVIGHGSPLDLCSEIINALIWLIPHLGHHCGGLLAVSPRNLKQLSGKWLSVEFKSQTCTCPSGNLYCHEYFMNIHSLHPHPFLLLWWGCMRSGQLAAHMDAKEQPLKVKSQLS